MMIFRGGIIFLILLRGERGNENVLGGSYHGRGESDLFTSFIDNS